MTSTSAASRKPKTAAVVRKSAAASALGFGQWKTALVKANPRTRIKIVRAGVRSGVMVSASEHFGMPRNAFAKLLGLSSATADRKIRANALLGQNETERLERIALIEDEAVKVFDGGDRARLWLTTKNAALGEVPLSMLDTETGAGEVRKVLSAIAYGGVA